MVSRGQTKYARVGSADVAYQVVGDGPIDLVCVTGQWSSIERLWDYAPFVDELNRLAQHCRLILLDRRGTGASDGVAADAIPTWEEWTEDIGAVLDAVGSERAAIFAEGEGGTIAILFATLRPERVHALVLANTSPRMTVADDYPIGLAPEAIEGAVEIIATHWGTPELAHIASPIRAKEPEFAEMLAVMMRSSSTPREAASQTRYILESVDVRQALPLVQAPTLVLHNRNPLIPISHARYMTDHIDGARFVEMSGNDTQLFWNPGVVDETIEFLTGERPAIEIDRVLATVLFTDIVGSTQQLADLGDRRWKQMLDAHDRRVRDQFRLFRGREINTTGDGFVASFDGPARAVRCASAITQAARGLGIEVRAGMHTGECEVRGEDLGGLAVHVAARVGALASAGEVLVSRTVVDLVVGSGIAFDDRGDYQLKGVPGSWHLFAARQ